MWFGKGEDTRRYSMPILPCNLWNWECLKIHRLVQREQVKQASVQSEPSLGSGFCAGSAYPLLAAPPPPMQLDRNCNRSFDISSIRRDETWTKFGSPHIFAQPQQRFLVRLKRKSSVVSCCTHMLTELPAAHLFFFPLSCSVRSVLKVLSTSFVLCLKVPLMIRQLSIFITYLSKYL